MAGWLLDDYVQGGQLVPDWTAPPFYERRLSMVRDFHLLLGWFVETLPTHGPTDPLPDMAYGLAGPDQQRAAVEDVVESLRADQHEPVSGGGARVAGRSRLDRVVRALVLWFQ